jgi:hypothetical protein
MVQWKLPRTCLIYAFLLDIARITINTTISRYPAHQILVLPSRSAYTLPCLTYPFFALLLTSPHVSSNPSATQKSARPSSLPLYYLISPSLFPNDVSLSELTQLIPCCPTCFTSHDCLSGFLLARCANRPISPFHGPSVLGCPEDDNS